MKIIIGLGNPGEKYKLNRHNVGFIILDELQKKWSFENFKFEKKFNAEVSQGTLESEKIILVKPQTFMNNSGETAQNILAFYKLNESELTVINDDLDIEIGNFKSVQDSSARGHNGVQNIIDHIGTQNFKRIKVGVETTGGRQNRKIPGEKYVLQDFNKDELEIILKQISDIEDHL